MNSEIQAAYQAADEVLRLLLLSSSHATCSHELSTLTTFTDDQQNFERESSSTGIRLRQRLSDLQNLDAEIAVVARRLSEHWQKLTVVRDLSFSDTGLFVVGELLTSIIPAGRRWIRETCAWLAMDVPVALSTKQYAMCNNTAESFPIPAESMNVLNDRLLREKSILLKNAMALHAAKLPDTVTNAPKLSASGSHGFTKADLREMTGYNDTAINMRLKGLNIQPAKGGRPRKGGPPPFTEEQALALLSSIIADDGAQEFIKVQCRQSLEKHFKP